MATAYILKHLDKCQAYLIKEFSNSFLSMTDFSFRFCRTEPGSFMVAAQMMLTTKIFLKVPHIYG